MTRFLAFLVMVVTLAFAPSAFAYTPPPMTAHVTDTAHKLTEPERIAIDRKLEDYRLRTSNELAVFITASLDGETIEDVANATARAWKLGAKGDKNGLLLVIAPVERKVRIEVAQGNQGALTDLQANDIIRTKIKPQLAQGHENYRAAVDDATDAIIATLDKGGATGSPVLPTPATKRHSSASGGDVLFGLIFFLFMLAVPIIFMVIIIRSIARAFSSNGQSSSSGWASGSTWSNDSSWSSSSNDSSWSSGSSGGGSDWGGGGGGGGDSGFSGGGGGGFDGGGSSDSF
jgi:uncharacterized protein